MKKSARKFWTVVLVIVDILLVGPMLLDFAVYWYDYMRVTRIRMVQVEETPCRMDIPVRYLDRRYLPKRGLRIIAADQRRYNLLQDPDSGQYILEISWWGLGGFAVYEARYEITSPEVLRKLLELQSEISAHDKESSLR